MPSCVKDMEEKKKIFDGHQPLPLGFSCYYEIFWPIIA